MRQMRAADAALGLGSAPGGIGRPASAAGAAVFLGAAFVALACAYRLLAFRIAMFDGDEYAFALVARDVLRGHPPDSGVFDNKPVGLTYLFALAEALGGQTTAAIRALGFTASAACGGLLYAASRRLGLDRALALSIAALVMLGALCLGGFGSMSELLAAPLLAAANLLLARSGPGRPSAATLLAVGAAFGLAFQVTYLAAPSAALTVAGFVLLAEPRRPLIARLCDGAVIGLAGAVAAAAVWLPQVLAGTWAGWATEQIHYHQGYRAASVDPDELRLGFALPLAGLCLPILTAGLARLSRGGGAKPMPWLVWVLGLQLVGAALAASASNRFYPHYLILALPAAALLTAALLADAPAPKRRVGGLALVLMLAVAAVVPAGLLRAGLASRSLEAQAAAAVDRLTRPGQGLFVFDESHAIYYLARRPAASRYVFPTHYLSSCEHAPAIVDPAAVVAEALARRPALVLIGSRCPPEIDAAALVRSAGYRQVEEIGDTGRRIAVYARSGR